ncbi:hypothetical protein QE152_g9231 [Popillia japonica]|uniref:Uncharacterized protein n=1 Tax=Popillia japonica TaxID=7064 RepID=A0AAW1LVG9_POPJA
MGSVVSANDRVEPVERQEFQAFQQRTTSEESDDFRSPKNRQCTDVFFLILMATFLIVLGVLIIYCFIHGDIYRVLNGYDNCANVCGRQNYKVKNDPRFACLGIDWKYENLLLVRNLEYYSGNTEQVQKICVHNCSEHGDYRQVFNRCLPKKAVSSVDSFISKLGWHDFFHEATEDLLLTWKEIVYLCIIGFVFSVILVALLRFFVGFLVWVVLIGVILFSVIVTGLLWYFYKQHTDDRNNEIAYFGITIANEKKIYYLVGAITQTIEITRLLILE